ncbi:beta-lactamase [Methanoculleus taiwanensis]|uniref:Beta-lactamase n=1 Tax=Methanoculleus taiwanensis TaxID=1550565 RepID=A0A498GW94_9EURY|nr:MBL fold metallo-hydrolase [Methanoculleus taiwanensis]RXE55211.1 beta-lactamase [Methanoculleus taiwanensis]
MVTIVEVYNNIGYDPGLVTAKGFSCYLQEAGLLFDTGGQGDVLLENMQRLGIDPGSVRRLVLSHDHWDHTGGAAAVLRANPEIEVFVPAGFSNKTLDLIEARTPPRIVEEWSPLAEGIFSTGPLGGEIPEQALAIEGTDGYLIVTGCAHPHIARIIHKVAERGAVWGVIGGLHTVSEEDTDALEAVSYLSASHCTDRIGELEARYPDAFSPGGAGFVHRYH